MNGCSIPFFTHSIEYLKEEYGDKLTDQDQFNKLVGALGKVEKIYKELDNK